MINFLRNSGLWKTRLQNCHRPEVAKKTKQLSTMWHPQMDPGREKGHSGKHWDI